MCAVGEYHMARGGFVTVVYCFVSDWAGHHTFATVLRDIGLVPAPLVFSVLVTGGEGQRVWFCWVTYLSTSVSGFARLASIGLHLSGAGLYMSPL